LYKALFDMKIDNPHRPGPAGVAPDAAPVPAAVSTYVYLLALIFAIALLATSLNLVLGFGGMYQFHHAVFYGFGAYAFALFATKSGLPLWMGYAIAPFCSAALGLVWG
jgi:branched-chain amino acid transport system permease protein